MIKLVMQITVTIPNIHEVVIMSDRFKISIVSKFTLVMLSVIFFIVLSLSAVFLYNFYRTTYDLTTGNLEISVEKLKTSIIGSLETYKDMLFNSGFASAAIYTERAVNWQETLETFLVRVNERFPEVESVYFSSNVK